MKITNKENISELIQFHEGVEDFNYNLAVDWAIELIQNGLKTDNVFMLASFSKPVDLVEIKPYISAVLSDLELEEKQGQEAIDEYIHYYLKKTISNDSIRNSLNKLYELYLKEEFGRERNTNHGLEPFYLLYHGWSQLEDTGYNYYFNCNDIDGVKEIFKEQAKIWIDKYIRGLEVEEKKLSYNPTIQKPLERKLEKSTTFWPKIKNWFS